MNQMQATQKDLARTEVDSDPQSSTSQKPHREVGETLNRIKGMCQLAMASERRESL